MKSCASGTFARPPIPIAPVNFSLRRGEIVGLAGLVGSGRTELARTIFGIDRPVDGTVRGRGPSDVHQVAPRRDRARHLPDPGGPQARGVDSGGRHHAAIFRLPNLAHFAVAYLVDRDREEATARQQTRRLNIRTPSVSSVAATLSGGNQQKVVLAKWLAMSPKVMLFDEPTRGIDVGAKSEIYSLIRALPTRALPC